MATKIKKQAAPKKVAAKKSEKKPSQASVEWGNRLVHSLALYTSASIVERKNGEITLELPFNFIVGKKVVQSSAKVVFEPKDFGLIPKASAEKLSDLEIGKRMFAMFCDHIRLNCYLDDKKLDPFKRLTIQTIYGDKYVWDGKNAIMYDAGTKVQKKPTDLEPLV